MAKCSEITVEAKRMEHPSTPLTAYRKPKSMYFSSGTESKMVVSKSINSHIILQHQHLPPELESRQSSGVWE
ncbi:MAG: hypothetical protein JSU80_12830 [Deltaproteobacteria bacterium]|nr:MAG: hypothetical protein JSU80_12830 [Deltaproteobacteria bacterium]